MPAMTFEDLQTLDLGASNTNFYVRLEKLSANELQVFRLLSEASCGFIYYSDEKKAVKLANWDGKPPSDIGWNSFEKKPNTVDNCVIWLCWDYQAQSVRLLQITKKTVLQAIQQAIVKYGDLRQIDLLITRQEKVNAKGLSISYSVTVDPRTRGQRCVEGESALAAKGSYDLENFWIPGALIFQDTQFEQDSDQLAPTTALSGVDFKAIVNEFCLDHGIKKAVLTQLCKQLNVATDGNNWTPEKFGAIHAQVAAGVLVAELLAEGAEFDIESVESTANQINWVLPNAYDAFTKCVKGETGF